MEQETALSHSSSSSGGTSSEGRPDPTAAVAAATKRKRTKRPRISSSSSTTTISSGDAVLTEEEEDMAHCLILLAQGHQYHSPNSTAPVAERFTSRKFTEAATTAGGKAGFYVYECKTCNKCFPSFQALGGHRASHKKPKVSAEVALALQVQANDHEAAEITTRDIMAATVNATVPLINSPTGGGGSKNVRVHECSICGAEFSSGQALGGHMRRHRPIGPAAAPEESTQQQESKVFSLDLNFPPPPMVFASSAALVDCHY